MATAPPFAGKTSRRPAAKAAAPIARGNGAREAILAAARSEFAAKGLNGARVAKIAECVGVNKQMLYYYIGNKDDLYRSALEWVYAEISGSPPHRRRPPVLGVLHGSRSSGSDCTLEVLASIFGLRTCGVDSATIGNLYCLLSGTGKPPARRGRRAPRIFVHLHNGCPTRRP